jgi:uncharacterized protein YybS (DUF2232 family)
LTRGALLAAVTVAMALIGLLPLGGELVLLLLPLPLSILTYQHGWKGAVLPLLVASLLLAFLGHISLALAVVLFYGLMGIALGNSLRKDAPLWIVFGGSAAAGAGGLASLWLLGKLIFKQDAFALMQQGLKTALGEAFKLYKSMPLASEQLKLLQQTQKMLLEMVDLAIPAMLALGLLLLLLVNFQASRKIIVSLGGSVVALPPFARWRLPWYMVWLFIAAFLLRSIGKGWLYQLSLNVYIVTMFLYVLQGLAIVAGQLSKWGLSRPMRTLILLLAYFFFGQILVLLGLFDTWFDFRKLGSAERR